MLGGKFYDPGHDLFKSNSIGDDEDRSHDRTYSSSWFARAHMYTADFAEVYHPGKDEWRLVRPFELFKDQKYFSVQGDLFEMFEFGIYACDVDGHVRSFMHSFELKDMKMSTW